MFKFLAILTITLTLLPTHNTYKVSDFKTWILRPSPPSGYHNIDTGPQTEGEILCFSDINGDQQMCSTDYIAVSASDPYNLLIYFWNDAASEFILDQIGLEKYRDRFEKVQEVMLVDLSDDGIGEIIVTGSKNTTNGTLLYSTLVFAVTQCHFMSCTYAEIVLVGAELSDMAAVPTMINAEGNQNNFMVFKDNKRYISQKKQNNIYMVKQFSQFINTNKQQLYNRVDKHFTSNIDYNGDCHSDLVLLSINQEGKYVLEFYEKQTNSDFNLEKIIKFQEIVKFVNFVDFDASGTVDIVLVVGNGTDVRVIYNANKEVTKICEKFQSFPFDVKNMKSLPIPSPIANPAILHFGDIDSDSYPDLLTLVTVNDFRRPALLKNVQIDGQRQFKESEDLNANLISEAKNPRQVAFFDLGQDGKLDIFVMVDQLKNSGGASAISRTCFMNNVKDDTLFIKILPLSRTSTYETGSRKISNAFGITMQWRITKLDGNKKVSLLNQKSQWNYGTLQLPFVSGGLGRTNNYVEDLTVGYESLGQKMNWSPIIPNSKLLVYEKDDQLKLETLLTNNERVNQVVYVSVGILVLLGLIIFFLNYRQNLEDKKDQYNFIQLIR